MARCWIKKAIFAFFFAQTFCTVDAYAASSQQSWAEWLGLVSYEPFKEFYKNFASLSYAHFDDGPLVPFVPASARDIHVYRSRFTDQVIAEYHFDKSDLAFFRDEWEELLAPSDIDHVLSVFKMCPWKRPIPDKGRHFRSVKQKRWGIRAYVTIEEDNLHAWYYWSVPEPTRGNFCNST